MCEIIRDLPEDENRQIVLRHSHPSQDVCNSHQLRQTKQDFRPVVKPQTHSKEGHDTRVGFFPRFDSNRQRRVVYQESSARDTGV